jgi:hypothetical protein
MQRLFKTTLAPARFTCLLLAITGFTLSAQAIATPITGAISFSGTSTIDGTSFVSATSFTSFEDVFVGSESALSGDYTGTSGASVTMTPFTWDPATASTPINPLWSFQSGGNTYSFDLSVLHEDFASNTGLLLSGQGTAHLTGPGLDKMATSGFWSFSAQTLDLATFTFSSTTAPVQGVPDGGVTLALLGGAVLGLGLMRRKMLL